MSAPVEPPRKVWTEAEIEALPSDGYLHEVVNGEVVMSPKNNFLHENVLSRLYLALAEFNRRHRLGVVRGSSAGFWMNNRNCRAPDISFIPKARLEQLGFRPNAPRFFPGAPDLAIEILSPSSTRAEIDDRLKDFFGSGTQIAWIIDPDQACVEVCYSPTNRKLLGPGAVLEGEHLLPGFQLAVASLFKDWDWE